MYSVYNKTCGGIIQIYIICKRFSCLATNVTQFLKMPLTVKFPSLWMLSYDNGLIRHAVTLTHMSGK